MPYDPDLGVGIANVGPEYVDGMLVIERSWTCPCGATGHGEHVDGDGSAVRAAWDQLMEHRAECPGAKASPYDVKLSDRVLAE